MVQHCLRCRELRPAASSRWVRMRLAGGAGIRWVIWLLPDLGWSSSKSPSTDAKVNYLVIRYLYFRSVRGGLDLSSSSTSTKVNCLVIKCLHFWSVRGDLQEGHGCSSRCQLPLFPMPIPIISSTKSRFLCAICLRPLPLSGLCEHKNGIFVRFEISMTQDVDPRDNVIAERVNGILLD